MTTDFLVGGKGFGIITEAYDICRAILIDDTSVQPPEVHTLSASEHRYDIADMIASLDDLSGPLPTPNYHGIYPPAPPRTPRMHENPLPFTPDSPYITASNNV